MRFLPVVGISVLWASIAPATTLVAVWSPHELLLGADSTVTTNLTSGLRFGSACKIESQNSSFFAFSGLVDDRVTGYRADRFAQEAIRLRGTVEQRLQRFVDLTSGPLAQSVALVKRDSPAQYAYLQHGHPVLQAIFALADDGPPALAVAGFELASDGSLKSFSKVVARGNDGHGPRVIYAGQQSRIREYLHEHHDWYSGLPSDIVKNLIELEIANGTGEVGGPVDIVKLTPDGAEWVQRKSQCAGFE